ncbi:hypothetical protein D0809_02270 [Flavobacterium circumlabens]|uniref:Uncharacterized protein n=1 Tax=Flavobacterium circumlabens TaxID=2133765 RepID=A0A4Y7UJ26_9FLAO|nr:hypothetical protein D0809_02270 [Flavobacterium circumlabens]
MDFQPKTKMKMYSFQLILRNFAMWNMFAITPLHLVIIFCDCFGSEEVIRYSLKRKPINRSLSEKEQEDNIRTIISIS